MYRCEKSNLHGNKVHNRIIKMIYREKIKKSPSAENKDMKTRGAISIVTTAESTAQKYTFSTRYTKVIIEKKLN